jgi:Ca2+/Na+ antiporter
LVNYIKEQEERLNKILDEKANIRITNKEVNEFANKINFIQNERLTHLIVTLFFGLFLLIVTVVSFKDRSFEFAFVGLILLILLIPYIYHYYKLENAIQRFYKYYDRLIEKLDS